MRFSFSRPVSEMSSVDQGGSKRSLMLTSLKPISKILSRTLWVIAEMAGQPEKVGASVTSARSAIDLDGADDPQLDDRNDRHFWVFNLVECGEHIRIPRSLP